MNFILLLVLSLNIFNPWLVSQKKKSDYPIKLNKESLGVEITAKSALVIDKKTDKILFVKNKKKVLPIASLTKLMSVLILLDNKIDWNKIIEVKKEDKRIGGRIYLGPGERVTNKNLLNLILVSSDNQSVITMIRGNGFKKKNFVKMMNNKAVEIGMNDTIFFDPTGLDPRNFSTVEDLVKLAKIIFADKRIIKILRKKEEQFKEPNSTIFHKTFSTDKLLNSFLIDNKNYFLVAGKTGYLPEADYCFLAEFRDKNNNEIISVVLGSKSDFLRFQDTKALIVWTFNNWSWGK